MRIATVLLACFLTTACKQNAPSMTPDASTANSVHAASPVDDTPTHDKGTVAPTDKPSEDQRPMADAGPKYAPLPVVDAEVEIFGAITGVPKGSTVYVAVSKKPCAADDAELTTFGSEKMPSPASFFIEVFVPQGSEGYLCAYALAGTNVVAFGTGDKNPMVMKGEGEVMFPGTKVELKAVKPRAAPKGLVLPAPK